MIDIVIIIACSIGGFLFGLFFKKQTEHIYSFYTDLVRYVDLMIVNIEGKQKELPTFNNEFCSECSSYFADYITDGKFPTRISKSMRLHVETFFANLNCASSDELMKHLQYYKSVFSNDLSLIKDNVKKSSVYSKLGALLGAMFGILFV